MIDDHAGTDRWEVRAACRNMPASLFFPERGEPHAPAKAVCAGCPVREECLEYALDNVEKWGVWGGTTERERRKLRRQLSPRPPIVRFTDPAHNPKPPKRPNVAESQRRRRAARKAQEAAS